MDTFETLQLRSSIAQLVDEFSVQYFEWRDWEEIWSVEWWLPYNFEFDNYYVYSLNDIYTALYYKMSKEIVIRWYEERDNRINLKTFYLRNRNK